MFHLFIIIMIVITGYIIPMTYLDYNLSHFTIHKVVTIVNSIHSIFNHLHLLMRMPHIFYLSPRVHIGPVISRSDSVTADMIIYFEEFPIGAILSEMSVLMHTR